jgi:uncharacterized membrane protein YdjX (TVP38/TMEM64 family)
MKVSKISAKFTTQYMLSNPQLGMLPGIIFGSAFASKLHGRDTWPILVIAGLFTLVLIWTVLWICTLYVWRYYDHELAYNRNKHLLLEKFQ